MKIETKAYGDIEITEDDVIRFPNGIPAFEDYTRFIVLSDEEQSPFHWLQSIDDPNLAFLIMDPGILMPEYQPEVLAHEVKTLFGDTNYENLNLWCILTIPKSHPENMTINLQGPVLISLEKKLGGQFISNDDSHQVRTPVLELSEAGETA
ncbi:MAG: flagellar assembly protein FliW [Leptospirales bacterium]